MKRRKSRKDRDSDRRARDDVPESARRLRELYAKGMAELEERRKVDPNAR